MDIFGGSSQNGIYIAVIAMHFRVQHTGYFLGLLKFQIFFLGA